MIFLTSDEYKAKGTHSHPTGRAANSVYVLLAYNLWGPSSGLAGCVDVTMGTFSDFFGINRGPPFN